MTEITNLFGGSRHLVGTLNVPDDAPAQPVGFILFNAGVVHRVGPHRFNVKLARALAKQGFASLRFDLSGQGDSRQASTVIPYLEQSVADVRAAMDHLERTVGVRHFVIAGLCSGAHHGLSTARQDERVVGLWMYDGFIYPTRKTRRIWYQHQLRQQRIAGLGRWLLRKFRKRGEGDASDGRPPNAGEYWQVAPPREVYGGILQEVVKRGVDIFMMHSGSFPDEYNYPEQFADGFSEFVGKNTIRCDFEPALDHTVTAIDAQRRVIQAILSWAERFQHEAIAQRA